MNINIKKIRVASRQSPLAKVQVDEVHSLLQEVNIDMDFQKTTYVTGGDKDKKIPLTANNPDDFFTDTLDEALLNHDVDVAVHSAKDLPQSLREGLCIFALTASVDETDAFVGGLHFDELANGARVGTSSVVRQEFVKKMKPEIELIDIRGTIEERIQFIEEGICCGIIVATAALKRLGLQKHIKDIMPWESTPLQGQLAIVGRRDDHTLKTLFSKIDVRKDYGSVYLVGAGPGDPDLITVKGLKALKQADCVFYDYLAHKDLLNYALKAQKVYVGKRKGAHTLPQAELSKLIRLKALEGKNVVRLKGGDPLIFGRGAEEIEYLRSYHIGVRVIPGVSSATAIPSSIGVPLTARDISSSVAFISGHGKDEKKGLLNSIDIPNVDTICFLMGLTKLDIILSSLKSASWKEETPILVISRGTCEDEKIVSGNLKTIAQKVLDQKLQPPALIIVGPTVKFWDQELYRGGRILYTGTNPEKFKPLGPIVHLPMIQIEPIQLQADQIQELMSSLHRYDMILFTSRFAVKYFFQILEKQNYDLTGLKQKNYLVIGESTAQALSQYQFKRVLIAQRETSEGLLQRIVNAFDIKNKKILFPRSSLSNPNLKEELTKMGAYVEQLTVYRNTKHPKRDLPVEGIEKILFTSPSTVRNFLQDYNEIPGQWKVLSKGPVTRQSLKEAGYESEVLISD